jgi:hypothetical protein
MTGAAGRKETVACCRVRLPGRAWVASYRRDTMSTAEESKTDGGRSPRAIAASHIGTDGTQLWYDTEREQAVVIEKADGGRSLHTENEQ